MNWIIRHQLKLRQVLLGWLLVGQVMTQAATLTLAQSVGQTTVRPLDERCVPVEIPPLGEIPPNAVYSQASCEAIELKDLACTTTGAYDCVPVQVGTRTTWQKYYCVAQGMPWTKMTQACTPEEVTDLNRDIVTDDGETIIGEYIAIPGPQGQLQCNGGTLNMCISGALCVYHNPNYYWIQAQPSNIDPVQTGCYNRRPQLFENGDQIQPLEQTCPINATRCECIQLIYSVDESGNGQPAIATIGPGQQCIGNGNVIARIFLNDGTVASRQVVATADHPMLYDIINGGVEFAVSKWGEEAVLAYLNDAYDPNADIWPTDFRQYLRNCNGQAIEENGYGWCILSAAPIGLTAGAVAVGVVAIPAAATASYTAFKAWVVAQGGIGALIQTYGYASTVASLVAAGVPLSVATTWVGSLMAAAVAVPILAAGAITLADEFGWAGQVLATYLPTAANFLDDAAVFAAQYVDELINYGDDALRAASAANEVVAACAQGVSGQTVSGLYGAAFDPLNEVIGGTAVNIGTSNPIENAQNCAQNLVGTTSDLGTTSTPAPTFATPTPTPAPTFDTSLGTEVQVGGEVTIDPNNDYIFVYPEYEDPD